MGQSLPLLPSPPSPLNPPPGWETETGDSHADFQLATWQGKIFSQIFKTQKVIRVQIWLHYIYTLSFTSFFAPDLVLNVAPRMRIYGIIVVIFFYSIAHFQFFRKWVILKEVNSFLKKSKKHPHRLNSPSQTSFFPTMTEFCQKLYQILFFDRKSHRLPCDFLENHTNGQSEQIEQKLLRSLRNDIIFTTFIILLYPIPSILVKILLEDALDGNYPIFMFVGLFIVGGALLWISVRVKSVMEQWMLGFINLRSWVPFIEQETEIQGPQDEVQCNTKQDNPEAQSEIQSEIQSKIPSKDYCENCGEPGQQNKESCQKCGSKISK